MEPSLTRPGCHLQALAMQTSTNGSLLGVFKRQQDGRHRRYDSQVSVGLQGKMSMAALASHESQCLQELRISDQNLDEKLQYAERKPQ